MRSFQGVAMKTPVSHLKFKSRVMACNAEVSVAGVGSFSYRSSSLLFCGWSPWVPFVSICHLLTSFSSELSILVI